VIRRPLLLSLAAALTLAAQVNITVKLPPFTKKTLPNGATLILVEKPDVPLVSLRALFKGGGEAVPADLAGLAPLTAELVRRGTATRTADQINQQLDSLGANLFTGATRQFSFLAIEYMKANEDASLDVFSDLLLHPSFPEPEFKKALAQRIDASKAAKDNPNFAISLYLPGFYFPPGHPYHHPLDGDEISLARITRDAMAGFHQKAWCGRNLVLIAAGDLQASALGPRLEKIASALPAGEAHVWAKAETPAPASARLLLVDKPDATQTYFVIAWPGISRTDPDRVAIELVNTLFGGRFTSMLNDALRVNSGLTYGAGSRVMQDHLPGSIYISTYTKTETTTKAIDMALGVLRNLREQGISAAQLTSAKNYTKGGFPTSTVETADQIASILGDLETFGLTKAEIDDLFPKIDALTLDQVNAVARKHYLDSNLQFLLIGNAAKIQDEVKKYAPKLKVVSIKDPGFEPPPF
jgi:zinc protease